MLISYLLSCKQQDDCGDTGNAREGSSWSMGEKLKAPGSPSTGSRDGRGEEAALSVDEKWISTLTEWCVVMFENFFPLCGPMVHIDEDQLALVSHTLRQFNSISALQVWCDCYTHFNGHDVESVGCN